MGPRSTGAMSQKLFLDYLESLGSEKLTSIYKLQPVNTKFIFRLLPPHAQYIIQRLLIIEGSVPFSEIRSWVPACQKSLQNKALWKLKQLYIIQGKSQEVWLNLGFRDSFLESVSGRPMDILDTDELAIEHEIFFEKRWNGILYCIVTGGGSHPLYSNIDSGIIGNLLAAGLIIKGRASFTITNQGFQFLLADSTEQLATLMVQYCIGLDDSELFEVLNLFALLAFLQIGHQYSVSRLTKIQIKHLHVLETYGLIHLPSKGRGKLFVPSKLASLLGFSGDSPLSLMKEEGFLIIETNYKVYAYTDSPLHFSILSLFMRIKTRFPNMIYALLQQDTVQEAFKRGITAAQIIKFIGANCHPVMRSKTPILPPTIVDQINLWELDRNRLKAKNGYLYQQFLNSADFDKTLVEANRLNVLLYAHSGKRLLIVSAEGHGQIKNFIKSNL